MNLTFQTLKKCMVIGKNYSRFKQLKKYYIFILIFANILSYGQDSDEALWGSDLTFSIGAGKNKFFENEQDAEFILASPIEIPISLNIGLSKKIEVGVEWSPILFNDRSPYIVWGGDSSRNQFGGHLQSGILNFQYSLNNNYRMNGYFLANGGYSSLHKKQWISGDYNELIGEGYNWAIGGGLRYQLGNMYDDVFPWYFDFSLSYTRMNINITEYSINDISQPKGESSWNDLNFGSIDVVMRIGYRIRFKK